MSMELPLPCNAQIHNVYDFYAKSWCALDSETSCQHLYLTSPWSWWCQHHSMPDILC
jgi:hypothetical protein